MKPLKAKNIDDYLAQLPAPRRAALQKLRRTIHAAAPEAVECISYQLPAFRLHGNLVAFAAWTKHLAFYPMSGTVVETFAKELQPFDVDKGTIRFQPDHPLPAPLIRKIVKFRLAQNRRRQPAARSRNPKVRAPRETSASKPHRPTEPQA